jgi:hypothetical protein
LTSACGLPEEESFDEDDLCGTLDALNGQWCALEKELAQKAFQSPVSLVLPDLTRVCFKGEVPLRSRARLRRGAPSIFLKSEAGRHHKEKAPTKREAEALEKEAEHDSEINDRCDFGAFFLQQAVVLVYVSIPTRFRLFRLIIWGSSSWAW